MPTGALARSKQLLLDSHGSTIEAQLEREAETIALCAVKEHAGEDMPDFLVRHVPSLA